MIENLIYKGASITKMVLALCLLISVAGHSQQEQIDSLKNQLAITQHDTTKVSLMLSLSDQYKSVSIDSMSAYVNKTLELSLKLDNYKLERAYNNVGLIHYYNGSLDSARVYFQKTLNLLDTEDDIVLRATTYSNISLTFQQSYDFEKRIDYKLKAVDLIKNNDAEVCLIYANLAIDYEHLGLYEKSREYYKKAYVASKVGKNYRILAYAIHGLTNILIGEDKYDSIAIYLKEGISLCSKTNSPEICYLMNNQLGNNYTNQKEYSKANLHLKLARKYAVQRNKEFDVAVSTVSLARNEFEMGNYNLASTYYQELAAFYENEPVPGLLIHAYQNYAETEASLGNFEKSYAILDEYVKVKDSLLTIERRELALEMEEKYETEKKEREIAEQQVQIQEQELSLSKKQQQITWWSILGGLLALGLGISFWVNRERQKRKQEQIENLQKQQEIVRLEALVSGEEKERVRLAQDLHDGINGDLAVIKYKFDALDHKKFTKEETETHTEAIGMLDNAIDQVRRISHNLAPPSLHNFSLLEAIRQYCTKIQSAHPLVIDFQTFGKVPAFDNEKETAIYRIIQELLNNIVKHAKATEVLIQLNHTSEMFEVTVEDDGKGFDTKNAKKGIGLQNIASRVSFLKGKLDIDSSKKGTSFSIQIPNATIHNL